MDRIDLAQDRELLKYETVGIRNSLAHWFMKVTICSVQPIEISPLVLGSEHFIYVLPIRTAK
jgi:hypothetical protein